MKVPELGPGIKYCPLRLRGDLSPTASHRGGLLDLRTILWSANGALSVRGKTPVDRPWPGLPGAERSGEMHKDPIWATCGPWRPDPGELEELERSRGDIVLSPVK